MDDTVGKIVAGLAVGAFSGLTFVAYKHPRAYSQLGIVLLILLMFCSVGVLIRQLTIYAAESALIGSGLVPQDKIHQMQDVMEALQLPPWISASILGATIYLVFLLSLPRWLLEK
jgi:hypothetical protein